MDNIRNFRQYLLRYTVGNSLTSLIKSHFLGWHAALCGFNAPIQDQTAKVHYNGDNHIQNFHLGRYVVGYTFGNHVLRLRWCIIMWNFSAAYHGQFGKIHALLLELDYAPILLRIVKWGSVIGYPRPPKKSGYLNENYFFFFSTKTCCGYSKELSHWHGSFEHTKHIFKLIGMLMINLQYYAQLFCLAGYVLCLYAYLLAHLSRRLMWGITWQWWSGVVRPHFQSNISLKSVGQFWSNFM